MHDSQDILTQHLSEQIALEEQLYRAIEEHLDLIGKTNYLAAKSVLTDTYKVLERNYKTLNEALDKLDSTRNMSVDKSTPTNGDRPQPSKLTKVELAQISKILRDDHAALNQIAISNTLLHTAALALNNSDLAALTLKNLETITPLIVKLGTLLPEVLAAELSSCSPTVNSNVATVALNNLKSAWKKALTQ